MDGHQSSTLSERHAGSPAPASISVIIPAYNAAATIGRALESVFAQTRLPDEIVVLDDGSQDDTAVVVRSLARRAPVPLRFLSQSNQGLSSSRNRLVKEARGDWIAFFDADDEYLPHALERLEALAHSAPEAVLLFGDAVRLEKGLVRNPSYIRPRLTRPGIDFEDATPPKLHDPAALVLLGVFTAPGTFIVRRSALLKAGPCDPSFRSASDRDMLLRLTQVQPGPWAFTWEALSIIHYSEQSLSSRWNLWQHGLNQIRAVDGFVQRSAPLTRATKAIVRRAHRESMDQAFYWASLRGPRFVLSVAGQRPRSISRPLWFSRALPALALSLWRSL